MTHADDEGRSCVGDVPLTDIADEFRTPTYVTDDALDAACAAERLGPRAAAPGNRRRLVGP